MKIEPKAFIAIERTMAAALHAEFDRLAASILPAVHSAVEKGDWAGAETIANRLTLKGIVAKVRPKLQEMAVSALLFGAHRVTSDVRATAFMKGKAVPAELENALNQLEHAVEHDASDTVRKKLHDAIARMRRGDSRAHMQKRELQRKHDTYTVPDKRPDHQTAEEFPPEPDESGETMRRKEKDAQADRWAKDDISVAELAATGGLLEPEQAPPRKKKRRARKEEQTLYVNRRLMNAADLVAWARAQGFQAVVPSDDMHVTVCYSKAPLDWPEPKTDTIAIPEGHDREMALFGDAVVLKFRCSQLQADHDRFMDAGASHDFDDYRPHVTISYGGFPGPDKRTTEPYHGPLVFGPEVFGPVKQGWKDDLVEQALKAETSLADRLNAVIQKGAKPPIDLAASLTTSRLVTLGFLTQAQEDGHSKYQVDEVLDEQTCPVCMQMNGKVFDVGSQYSRTIQALSASDPMDLKALAPWPDESDVAGLDEDELQAGGYGAPPFHAGCRGMLSLVENADSPAANSASLEEDAGDGDPGQADEPGWSDWEVKQLGWERFEVTDPEAFADVDAAYEAGDYDQAQALIGKWKAQQPVEKEDEFEGPIEPKKKREPRAPAGRLRRHRF